MPTASRLSLWERRETRRVNNRGRGSGSDVFMVLSIWNQRWPNTSPERRHNKRVAGSCTPPCFRETEDGHALPIYDAR